MKESIGSICESERIPKIESRLLHILDALPFGVFLVDSNRKILAVNEAMKSNFGFNETQLIGKYCPILVHQTSEPIVECPLNEALRTGEAAQREIFDPRNQRWIDAAVYPILIQTEDDRPIYLHFVRDITEIKATEAELSRSLEHHRALCNILQDLQHCQNSEQIIKTLMDQIISLSWLGMAATAVGFLSDGKHLNLVAHRNVSQAQRQRCRRLGPGECLCGKAAEAGKTILSSSNSINHNIKYEGMIEHQHLVLPIRHKGNTLGVIALYLKPGDKIGDFRLGFLEAAAAAAGAALDGQLAREEVARTKEKFIAQAIHSHEDERKRVASDLHDQLAQSLSAILMEMQSKAYRKDAAGTSRRDIEKRIRGLIDEIRRLAGQLRPPILDDYGLDSALARKIKEISGLRDIAIDYQSVSSTGTKSRLPDAVEVGLYRVAMEALDNAIFHSAASRISVVILWQKGKVTLVVEDDGQGFDFHHVRLDMDHCRGLIDMEERIALLGGTLRIETALNKGTMVRAEIPEESIR